MCMTYNVMMRRQIIVSDRLMMQSIGNNNNHTFVLWIAMLSILESMMVEIMEVLFGAPNFALKMASSTVLY